MEAQEISVQSKPPNKPTTQHNTTQQTQHNTKQNKPKHYSKANSISLTSVYVITDNNLWIRCSKLTSPET
jgi:hypothetical protein